MVITMASHASGSLPLMDNMGPGTLVSFMTHNGTLSGRVIIAGRMHSLVACPTLALLEEAVLHSDGRNYELVVVVNFGMVPSFDEWTLEPGIMQQIVQDCTDLFVLERNPVLGKALRFIEPDELGGPPDIDLIIYPQ